MRESWNRSKTDLSLLFTRSWHIVDHFKATKTENSINKENYFDNLIGDIE